MCGCGTRVRRWRAVQTRVSHVHVQCAGWVHLYTNWGLCRRSEELTFTSCNCFYFLLFFLHISIYNVVRQFIWLPSCDFIFLKSLNMFRLLNKPNYSTLFLQPIQSKYFVASCRSSTLHAVHADVAMEKPAPSIVTPTIDFVETKWHPMTISYGKLFSLIIGITKIILHYCMGVKIMKSNK